MLSYSPYDNTVATGYPALYITAGLNDPRVSYHEPAKWCAKLRALRTNDATLIMRTEMGAGHGGPSGRYDRWRDEALVTTFAARDRWAEPASARGDRHDADTGERGVAHDVTPSDRRSHSTRRSRHTVGAGPARATAPAPR